VARLGRVLAACELVLVAAVAAGGASPAWADDPPPTTTVPAVTEPAPDPAPPKPKLTPKPQPKPRPRPVSPAPRPSSSPAPAYRPTTSAPVATTKPRVHPQPKPKKVHRKARPKPKVVAPKPKINITRSLSPIGSPSAAQGAPSPGSSRTVFLLIVASLAIAIGCFGVASVPATHMPRRATTDFMVRHKLDLTVLGVGLLIAAALASYWSAA